MKSLTRDRLFTTPWTVAYQAPLSTEFSRQEYWGGWPFPSPWGSSRPRDWTQVSCLTGRPFTIWAILNRILKLFCELLNTLGAQILGTFWAFDKTEIRTLFLLQMSLLAQLSTVHWNSTFCNICIHMHSYLFLWIIHFKLPLVKN